MNEPTEALLENDEFNVFVPNVVDLVQKSGDPEENRLIGGFCSTEDLDRQGEIVVAKGLDFDEFRRYGYFNDNHKQETSSALGYPTLVELRKGRWYTEGNLIKDYPPAEQIWSLAKALAKSDGPRRLGFSIEGKVMERDGGNRILKAKVRHVAITHCFPGNVRVCGAAEAVTRRWYSGAFVEIELSTGEKLSGTPNHPVFTNRGWVPLGELDEIYDRIGRFSGNSVSKLRSTLSSFSPSSDSVVTHDVQDVPPFLDEVFNSALDSGNRRRIRSVSEPEFHGDGLGGDVNIVNIDRFLKRRLDIAFFKKFGEKSLPATDKDTQLLASTGTDGFFLDAGFSASNFGLPSSQERLSLRFSHVSKSDLLPFSDRSFHSSSLGYKPNTFSSDSVTGRDSGRLLSPSISFSNLTSKRFFNFSGHVYNLQSTHGWYEANGIVAHNSPVNTFCTWSAMISKAFASSEAIDVADARAVSLRGSVVPQRNEVAAAKAVRDGEMTLDQAVARLQKLRPDLSKSFHTMIVMTAMRMRG